MADLDVERRSHPQPEMGAMAIFGRSSLCPNCASTVTCRSRRKGLDPSHCFFPKPIPPRGLLPSSIPGPFTCRGDITPTPLILIVPGSVCVAQSFRVIPQIGPLILGLGVAVRTLQFLPLRRKLRLLWNKIVSQIARFDFRVGKALRAILATKIPAWHKRKYAPTI